MRTIWGIELREITKAKMLDLIEKGIVQWPPFTTGGRIYGFVPDHEDEAGGLVWCPE